MTTELTTQVLSGLAVAALSGTAGAAYQLHRRRSRPFIVVTQFAGDVFADGEEVDIPEDVRRRLDHSLVFGPMGTREPLRRVSGFLRSQATFSKGGANLATLLSQAVKPLERASSDEEVLEAILPALRKTLFDEVVTDAMLSGGVSPLNPQSRGPEKVKVYYEKSQQGGCFYFGFRGGPVYFGSGLEESGFKKERLSDFVEAVKTLDRDWLARLFRDLAQLLEQELASGDAAKGQLARILNEHSGWETYLYVANYGETAMLVLPDALLQVRKGRFDRAREEKCELAVFYEQDGEEHKRTEKNGILIPPSQEKKIVFVTAERQISMKAGNEFRGLFQDGTSRARIVFRCVSAGLGATHAVKTSWLPFKGTS